MINADPPPDDALASAGLLRWELELALGASRTIELRTCGDRAAGSSNGQVASVLPSARAEADDPRAAELFRTCLDDLRALLVPAPGHPSDVYPAAGAPWRWGLAPAEALWAARMALPLGTRLAEDTLRTLARTQLTGRGPDSGRIPGALRAAGPHLPPSCTGMEATLAFLVVLAEARRWGLADRDVEELLPAAERCLRWVRSAADEGGLLPEPSPTGPRRCETQAHAHRAARHPSARRARRHPPRRTGRDRRLHPGAQCPLGALQLSGLKVAGEPFAVRVSRLGLVMVEEAADGLQLGV